MHHRITYMSINFQQTRVSRSVQTVDTNIFVNNCKWHKFASNNNNFEKYDYIRYASSYNVHVYHFLAKSSQKRAYKFICENKSQVA